VDRSIVRSVGRLSFDEVDSWQCGGGTYGDNDARRITRRVCRRDERQINVTPSPFEQSFAQWPRTGDTGLVDCAERGSMMVCGGGGREGRGLTALDILPATRGYHQWDSMRDHVLPPRYPEKCCPLDSAAFLSVSPTLSAYARETPVAVADFQVLSHLPFIIHQVPHRDDICLSKVRDLVDVKLIHNCDWIEYHLLW